MSIFNLIKATGLLIILQGLLACTSAPHVQPKQLSSPTQAEPRIKEYSWMSVKQWHAEHKADTYIASQGNVDVLFIGDSITAAWPWKIWQKHFAEFNAANFGIGGDKTQNVLWRLEHGATGKLSPKVVNLLIGVNNFAHDNASPESVFDGVRAVVDKLHQSFPKAQIIVNSILPWGEQPNTTKRQQVSRANQLIKALAKRPYVQVYDFGPLFLTPDGKIDKKIMADFLHPTKKGYQIYAKALNPVIGNALKHQ